MKIILFTFYYPPDLCAGSFRAVALVEQLSKKLGHNGEVYVISTHPNRYASHRVKADDVEVAGNIKIHRIAVPSHSGGVISQARTFFVFTFFALALCRKIKPDFMIGTTSRLMTGILTWVSARLQRRRYYIDMRDIFSETISDLLSRNNRFVGVVAKMVFSAVERTILNGAAGVNVVSEGFPEYFQRGGVKTAHWSFFPNGVDREFATFSKMYPNAPGKVKTILYAGNIGSGQGLDRVVPLVAKSLGEAYRFVIVGDGGAITQLKDALERECVNNVSLVPPVDRVELLNYYRSADLLFLHLNDVPAFRRVLPSKIFEYAALGKPIVAGLNGYAASFVTEHIPYACVFSPCDSLAAESCVLAVEDYDVSESDIREFVATYSRGSIMERMAEHLLVVAADIPNE